MNGLRNKRRGPSMVPKIFMWAEHRIITGATKFMQPNTDLNGFHNKYLPPRYGNMPALSSADAAARAAIDLCFALRNPHPALPISNLGDFVVVLMEG